MICPVIACQSKLCGWCCGALSLRCLMTVTQIISPKEKHVSWLHVLTLVSHPPWKTYFHILWPFFNAVSSQSGETAFCILKMVNTRFKLASGSKIYKKDFISCLFYPSHAFSNPKNVYLSLTDIKDWQLCNWLYLFICLLAKYLRNHWTDLHAILRKVLGYTSITGQCMDFSKFKNSWKVVSFIDTEWFDMKVVFDSIW